MAITFHATANGASKTAGTTVATSTTLTLTSGDLICVAFACDDTAGTYSCADTVNTYIEDVTALTNAGHVQLHVFRSIAGTTANLTITVTHPSLTARALVTMSFSGTASSSPFDTSAAGATGTSATPASGSVTPSADNYVVFGAVGVEDTGNNTATESTNFTGIQQNGTIGGGAASNIYCAASYNIQTTAAARNYQPGITSASWADHALVYKVTAAAATRVPYRNPLPPLIAQ